MKTQRILRRDANIKLRRQKGMTYRALGRMFKLTHTQVWNICNKGDHDAQI